MAPRSTTTGSALLLAALLAASSCSCSSSRLLQQDSTSNMPTMANMTLPRVNATIASITPNTSTTGSTSATNATTFSAIRLRMCAWDQPSRACRLDASYSLSSEVPEPSEYGAWVLTGELSAATAAGAAASCC